MKKHLGLKAFGNTAACQNNLSYNILLAYQDGSSTDADQSAENISNQLTQSTGMKRKPRRVSYLSFISSFMLPVPFIVFITFNLGWINIRIIKIRDFIVSAQLELELELSLPRAILKYATVCQI